MFTNEKEEEEKEEEELVVSAHYFINDREQYYVYIDSIEQLNLIDYTKVKAKSITVLFTGDLHKLLGDFLYEHKYEPFVCFNNGHIEALTIKLDEIIVRIQNPAHVEGELQQEFINEAYYKKYSELSELMYKAVINKNNLSRYDTSFFETIRKYMRKPLVCSFVDDVPVKSIAVDFNKAYTSNLMDLKYFPVFGEFDGFKKYNKETIEDYSLYYVENKGDMSILMNKKFDVVTGYTLNNYKLKVNILFVAQPYKIVPNHSASVIKAIYESDLLPEHKKFIVNMTIGLCGKLRNRKTKTRVFTDYQEAYEHASTIPGSKITNLNLETISNEYSSPLDAGTDAKATKTEVTKKAYVVSQSSEEVLVDGFLPIQFFIYDIMRLKMQKLFDEYTSKGATIYGMNTDSLFINSDFQIKKVERDNNTFESIGCNRFDVDKFCPQNKLEYTVNENDCQYIELFKPNLIKLKDEYDTKAINAVLNETDKLIIKANVPGAGKTTCLKNLAKEYGLDHVLFVAPYNTLVCELVKEGLNTVTLAKLFGIIVGDDKVQNNTVTNVITDDIDIVVFDEIFAYTLDSLARIKKFMESHKDIKFYATGDLNQNPPIENISIQNPETFYDEVITRLFPNEIILQESKRMKTEADKKKLLNIRKDVLESDISLIDICKKYFKVITKPTDGTKDNNITYHNHSAQQINELFHEMKPVPKGFVKVKGINYYKGLEVVCKKHLKVGHQKAYVNFTYLIDKINEKYVTIKDISSDEQLTLFVVQLEHFSLSHARTCHSVQGLTVKGPMTIYDITSRFASRTWFWTAITRAQSINDIYVYYNDTPSMSDKNLKAAIEKKIKGHVLEDTNKKRHFTNEQYVTTPHIINLIESQNYQCCLCSEPLELNLTGGQNNYQFSINRRDNKLAHVKGNCEITCLDCQHIHNQ